MLEVVLHAVRPDPLREPHLEEMRLEVAALPLRLDLGSDLLAFAKASTRARSDCSPCEVIVKTLSIRFNFKPANQI